MFTYNGEVIFSRTLKAIYRHFYYQDKNDIFTYSYLFISRISLTYSSAKIHMTIACYWKLQADDF